MIINNMWFIFRREMKKNGFAAENNIINSAAKYIFCIFAADYNWIFMKNVVGRNVEVNELMRLYESGRPEFVAVYGRRRVGKTYLIKETFNGLITFQHSGV